MTVKMVPEEYMVASSLTLNVGTSTDSISDIQSLNDGNEYHIDEINAASPAISLVLTFKNIRRFSKMAYKAYYKGGTTHYIQVQLFNHDANSWATISTIEYSNGMNYQFLEGLGASGYIKDSQVEMRFYHPESGNSSHDFYLEYAALIR